MVKKSMSNCQQKQINLGPLSDGIGLYTNGNNLPPEGYLTKGVEIAGEVTKIDGKKVITFIGMSNWNQEIKTFLKLYRSKYKHRQNTWFNAGRGGWDLRRMAEQQANDYWQWYHTKLIKVNIAPNQVQVLFFKNSLAGRGGHLPVTQHVIEYQRLLQLMLDRAAKELPNLKQVFLSSAVYSGYASSGSPRIEPNAYYEGVAIRNLVDDHIKNPRSYWLAWGPYLWADGEKPRSDGLKWLCTDFEDDGVHPKLTAEQKVSDLVLGFMETNPTTGWFYA